MSLIKWRDSFNTGVSQFDKEHQKIVELIQRLFEAVRDEQDGDFGEIIKELVEYTDYHFTNEEQAMAEVGYSELEEHRKEHEKLIAQAKTFLEISKDMNSGQVRDFYQFLREWLIDHIIACDKKYGGYIASTSKE